jgi:hypothetical protein
LKGLPSASGDLLILVALGCFESYKIDYSQVDGVRMNAFRSASMYTGMAARMTQLLQENAAAIIPYFLVAIELEFLFHRTPVVTNEAA